MQFCTTCGRPRIGTARICTTCGTTFPGAAAAEVTGADDGGRAGQQDAAESGRRQPGRRARPPTVSRPGIIAAIAVTIIAAGVGVALWLAGGHGSSGAGGPPGGSPAHGATPGAGSATETPRPSGAGDRSSAPATSRPATTPPATITSTGPVTVTRSAARHPQAHAIAAFLNRYFAAINSHDYQRYVALLSPEMAQRVTPDRFAAGFAATADSAETLTRIAPGDGGVTEAAVTFTSHQQPNAANHEESCTNWSISLFLRRVGRTYQIQTPPPGYRAGSTPCD